MTADVASSLNSWSTTESSNSPSGSTPISTNLDDNLRMIQAVTRFLAAKGSNIASATTTDLSTATGNFVDITGTTTITGLGTLTAGMWFVLRFNGALTFTHNATSLILPGGANITTASGDIAYVISLGSGNWVCTNYVRASALPALAGANANITSLTGLTTPLSVAQGGSGAATFTDGGVLIGNGTSAVQVTAVGTAGQVLTSNGAGSDPTFQDAPSAATQAEQEAFSSTTKFVTPGRQQFHPSAAKAWVSFNGTSTLAVIASYNMDGSTPVTDSGTGNYVCNIGTDMTDGNYAAAGICKWTSTSSNADNVMQTGTNSAGGFNVVTIATANGSSVDNAYVSVVFYGDQA